MSANKFLKAPLNSAVALATALTLGGCTKKESESNTLAIVEGEPIAASTYEFWWNKSPREDSAESREALLEKLIERPALVQRARQAGLENDPQVIEAMESVLIARFKELELQPRIASAIAPEEDARAVYEAEKNERFRLPARSRLAVLWFETRGQAPLAARYQPRLEQVRSALRVNPQAAPVNTGFGSHSVRNSEHRATRYKGGNVGWVEHDNDPASPFLRAISEIGAGLTETGQVSEVTTRPEGIFLVRLLERQSERVQEFSEVRASIEQRLLATRRGEVQQQFEQETRDGLTIERFPENLSALNGLPSASSLALRGTSAQ